MDKVKSTERRGAEPRKPDRQERLALALRENLQKRKDQARQRAGAAIDPLEAGEARPEARGPETGTSPAGRKGES